MPPDWETNDGDDLPHDSVDRAQPSKGVHRVGRKLKYKEKGYRIEGTRDGKKWSVERFYRSESDMRRAYKACTSTEWNSGSYRMVYPDGRIVPWAYNEANPDYRFRMG